MNGTDATPTPPVRVAANYVVTKRLGNWTTARRFQVGAHRGHVVSDPRSQHVPAGDIQVEIDLDHAMLKLVVPYDAMVDDWASGLGALETSRPCPTCRVPQARPRGLVER